MKKNAPTSKTVSQYSPMTSVTSGELRVGIMHAARLVRRYGMIYWPIVERLQSEITMTEKREKLLGELLKGEVSDAKY